MTFQEKVAERRPRPLTALGIKILQVNLGYRCNMQCRHCHIGAGPARTESMDKETVEAVIRVLRENDIGVVDITGGAPELNPHFRRLVEESGRYGRHVVVRTNLTIFFEPAMEYLPEFYRDCSVELTASFPYYVEADVDRVRGEGAFLKSVEALRRLNELGYGCGRPDLKLNLVYNPSGAFLAPAQQRLEEDYRRELGKRFRISFDNLYTFSNMPIGRFRDYLVRSGNFETYMRELSCAFNAETLDGLMCRHLISVGWDGALHDCDFNQMLGLGLRPDGPVHISGFDHSSLSGREITVGEHCFGCTAGQGST